MGRTKSVDCGETADEAEDGGDEEDICKNHSQVHLPIASLAVLITMVVSAPDFLQDTVLQALLQLRLCSAGSAVGLMGGGRI